MKEFNILTDALPETVTIYEKQYPVYTSHKNWIKIIGILENDSLDEKVKMAKAISLCYKDSLPPNAVSAYLGMLMFLNRGALDCAPKQSNADTLFSFEQDADEIYSSFYSKYNIDLLDDDVHWYKFCALFKNLICENAFGSLISIRTFDESTVKDASKRRKISKMKKDVRLKKKSVLKETDVAKSLTSVF